MLPQSVVQGSDLSTAEAISRSRTFLETKLIPDLDQATSFLSHLEDDRLGYIRLQGDLKTTLQEKNQTSVLAHLGQGIHLPVEIDADALIIVSSGLKENPQDYKSKSGLYIQLQKGEAINFAEKKVNILTKRIKMAREKVALIQGHVELTTTSVGQLERLQADPSASLIDYMQT